jgi:hypothetical protein
MSIRTFAVGFVVFSVFMLGISTGLSLASDGAENLPAKEDRLGELIFVLGADYAEAAKSFEGRFELKQNEPDFDRPDLTFYTLRDTNSGASHGYLLFKKGKLVQVSQELGTYKQTASEDLVVNLITALRELRARSDDPIRVGLDDGKVDGKKIDNTRIVFSEPNAWVELTYYDAESGNHSVCLTRKVRHPDPAYTKGL